MLLLSVSEPMPAVAVKRTVLSRRLLLMMMEKRTYSEPVAINAKIVYPFVRLRHFKLLTNLLEQVKMRHIHTAIEMCGNAPYKALQMAAPFLDVILFDIKSMDTQKHKEYTGWGNEQILENLTALCRDFPAISKCVRTPVIPGFNDTPEEIQAIRTFLQQFSNVSYEALPYHEFGRGKYKALGRPYPMGDVKLRDEMREYIETINAQGLTAR